MHSEKGTIDILNSALNDINLLVLQGVPNWHHVMNAYEKIRSVIENLTKAEQAKEEAYMRSIEDAKQRREQAKKKAAECGEEILGGETIQINADGTQEVLIP